MAYLARGISKSRFVRDALEMAITSPAAGGHGIETVSTLDWLEARVAESVRAETDRLLARLLKAVYAFAEYCMDDPHAKADLIRSFEGFITEALDAK